MLLLASLLLIGTTDQVANARSDNMPDPNKVICKNLDRTGSRLSSDRVCMTRSEWDERRRQAQRELEQMQGNMGRCPNGSSC